MFALYEFEDKSVEVGSAEWIKNPASTRSPSASASPLNDPNWLKTLVNKKVTVCWPSTSSTGGKKTVEEYAAVVLAVNESKIKLIEKRNKVCEGLSMDTDVETGRGKRRKVTKRISSSESSGSEDEKDSGGEKVSKASKKRKPGKTLDEYMQKANGLRKKLLEDEPHEESDVLQVMDFSEDDDDKNVDNKHCMEPLQAERRKNKELKDALAKEKAAKEQLQQNLLLLQGLPSFIKTFRGFMTDMKSWTMKNQTPVQQANHPAADQADPEAVGEDPHDNIPDAMVALSKNVMVHKTVLARCNTSSYKKLTSDLLVAVFGRDTLISSSLTGAKNTKGESKPPLAKEKVEAIISYVQTKFGTSTSEIRMVMTTKLNNEVKLQKRREVVLQE